MWWISFRVISILSPLSHERLNSLRINMFYFLFPLDIYEKEKTKNKKSNTLFQNLKVSTVDIEIPRCRLAV